MLGDESTVIWDHSSQRKLKADGETGNVTGKGEKESGDRNSLNAKNVEA